MYANIIISPFGSKTKIFSFIVLSVWPQDVTVRAKTVNFMKYIEYNHNVKSGLPNVYNGPQTVQNRCLHSVSTEIILKVNNGKMN